MIFPLNGQISPITPIVPPKAPAASREDFRSQAILKFRPRNSFGYRISYKPTMGVIGEICPFRQKIIFQISTVLTILSDSQDLKPYVFKKISTSSSLQMP